MAIKSHDSSEQVVKESKLYTGLLNQKVVAINPDKEGLKAIGINTDKEPEYIKVEDGIKKVRLDFFTEKTLPNSEIFKNKKVTFWLENKVKANKDANKWEWINNIGQSTYSVDVPDYPWYKKEGARKALVGEVTLIQFISAWMNIKAEDEVFLDNISKIFEGDYSELRALLAARPTNEFKGLLGVNEKDGKYYQTVYTGRFGRATETAASNKHWISALEDQYSKFKADYQNSLEFKLYVAKITSETPDNEEISKKPTDDLPF